MPNDYFCVLPFFNREIMKTGKETSCCLLPEDHDIEEVRRDMSNGIRSRWCQKCWTIEKHGLESDRQIKNKSYDFFVNENISDVEQKAYDRIDKLESKFSWTLKIFLFAQFCAVLFALLSYKLISLKINKRLKIIEEIKNGHD